MVSKIEDLTYRQCLWLAGWLLWASAALLLMGVLVPELAEGESGCELPGRDSEYGFPSQGWFPPGVTCDNLGDVVGPSFARGVWAVMVLLVLIVLPMLAGVARHRERHRSAFRRSG